MPSSDDVKQYVQNQTEVALRLTREVLLKEAAGYNAIFSPLSIHVLLSTVAAGSAGPQKDQLLTFLKADSAEQLHAYGSDVVAGRSPFRQPPHRRQAPEADRCERGLDRRLPLIQAGLRVRAEDRVQGRFKQVDFKTKVSFLSSLLSFNLVRSKSHVRISF